MSQQNQFEIAQFLARNSPEGLFMRFAQGRRRGFWVRQTMTLIGSATLAMLASGGIGLLTAVLGFAGDAVDCVVLAAIARRYDGRVVPPGARTLAFVSGGLQAISIAACVAICWLMIAGDSARFFAASFLMSAAINAGLVRRWM